MSDITNIQSVISALQTSINTLNKVIVDLTPVITPSVSSYNGHINDFNDDFTGTVLAPYYVKHQWWSNTTTKGDGFEADVASQVSLDGNTNLVLTAIRQNVTADGSNKTWASGLVQTGGIQGVNPALPSKSFTYGLFEARIKIPDIANAWPAFWLMPEATITTGTNHDGDGEIDIIDNGNSSDPHQLHGGTIVHGATAQGIGPVVQSGYHIYAVDWQPTHLAWYVDGIQWFNTTNTSLIPSGAAYIILDLAIGGSWGTIDILGNGPVTMLIDWVRHWA